MIYPASARGFAASPRTTLWVAIRPFAVLGLSLVAAATCPAAASVGWRIDPDFRPLIASEIGPEVYAISPAPEGKIIIAGAFTSVDDIARPGLARLNADGTLDATFQPDVSSDGLHLALAVQADGKVLVGGMAPPSNVPVQLPAVVRLNTDGSRDTSFESELTGASTVRAIKLTSDGRIVVARAASAAVETPLARLLPNGALDPSFPNAVGPIAGALVDLDLTSGGRMLVTGIIEENLRGAALLDADGSRLAEFTAPTVIGGPGYPSAAEILDDGSVTLLTTVGSGIARPTLAYFDATGAERLARNVGVHSGISIFQTLLADGDGVLFPGFHGFGALKTVERYTDAGAPDRSFAIELGDVAEQVQSSGSVHAMAFDATGALLAAGDFTSADGMAFTGVFRLVPDTLATRLANISTRAYVGPGNDVLIAGFVVSGTEPQRVLIRAIAENLAAFDIPGRATDVRLAVFRAGADQPLHQSETYLETPGDAESTRVQFSAERLGAFPLEVAPLPGGGSGTADAATVLTLDPGGYTVVVEASAPGIGLVEIYDANGVEADRKLVNISGRARVGTGNEQVIAGFVIDRGPKRVLLRAVGPGLATLVSGTLADPTITLVNQSDGSLVDANDNWGDADNAAAIEAASRQVTGLQLASGSADAALLVELPAGAYTMIVTGSGESTGIALAEVYEVP